MRNRFCNSHDNSKDFGNVKVAPIDSAASRRSFLKALAVAGASAALPSSGLLGQTTSGVSRIVPGRIDVHHHMFPPFYMKAMEDEMKADGFTPRPWTPATSLDMMDKAGVATAISSPVQRLVMDSMSERSEKSSSLARQSNEYGAQLVRDHPGRFGNFAALPLPDADASLKEIAYAMDTLKADGIALWTSYMDKWVGDPAFWPAYEELNRRNAVVFYHTARAIDSLLWMGTLSKFPNVRHIFSHSGGAFTVLAARIMDDFPKNRADKVPNGVEYEIKKLYFDTAHASKAPALDALKDIVPVSQIMYGSDVPLRNYDLTDPGLDMYPGFSESDWRAVNRGNAERLFPRLKP